MEYASGGELFTRIASAPAQRFGEAQARFFFQQLLGGIAYLHSQAMAHRDLKLEKCAASDPALKESAFSRSVVRSALLMDGTPRPRLAICDFGYTKSEALHSAFHTSNVGTPSYLAPELLTLKQGENYDGKAVDVWAVGVVLYVMLVGGYPFGDLGNGRELVRRISTASYQLPVPLSAACMDLFTRVFVVDPRQRASVAALQMHPWVTADPPPDLAWPGGTAEEGLQSPEALAQLLREAAGVPPAPAPAEGDGLALECGVPYTEADHLRDSMLDIGTADEC
jgi:serine/threonine-protein kinase SRK2